MRTRMIAPALSGGLAVGLGALLSTAGPAADVRGRHEHVEQRGLVPGQDHGGRQGTSAATVRPGSTRTASPPGTEPSRTTGASGSTRSVGTTVSPTPGQVGQAPDPLGEGGVVAAQGDGGLGRRHRSSSGSAPSISPAKEVPPGGCGRARTGGRVWTGPVARDGPVRRMGE
ncbi:hypothetical protein [Georgenia sp. SUBG003]|uniref:hypothetical protein n=1 Tax=Georgenia sp. SUBG003 TaxID=1497974 RepID=UPI003AB10B0E